jgi:hypothetical protein
MLADCRFNEFMTVDEKFSQIIVIIRIGRGAVLLD